MDVSAVILHKLLKEQNLEIFSKLKLSFLDPAYSTLYSVINSHYDKYNTIPSFEELELKLRDGQITKILASLKLLEVPDIEIDIVFDALVDHYTQTETVKLLDKFIDKLPLFSSEEIKEQLSNIALTIEEKTLTSESIVTMQDIPIFQHDEDIVKDRVYLGLNNDFDALIGGAAKGELIFIGGMRGSGKSIVSSNLFINQYESDNSCLYFSIEMSAFEVHQRHMSMLSGVDIQHIRKGTLSESEIDKLAKVRYNMFIDGEDVYKDFLSHRDKFKFEETLMRNCKLKPNQMVLIDDRNLNIGAIDLHIGKMKARLGDSLKVVIVDYINQIQLDSNISQYDWMPQIELAKKLKNLARKYEVVMISPYQIDKTGEARFSKGILDSADISLILKNNENMLQFESTKMRSASKTEFVSGINWNTLRISPKPLKIEEKKTLKKVKSDDDIPWDT